MTHWPLSAHRLSCYWASKARTSPKILLLAAGFCHAPRSMDARRSATSCSIRRSSWISTALCGHGLVQESDYTCEIATMSVSGRSNSGRSNLIAATRITRSRPGSAPPAATAESGRRAGPRVSSPSERPARDSVRPVTSPRPSYEGRKYCFPSSRITRSISVGGRRRNIDRGQGHPDQSADVGQDH